MKCNCRAVCAIFCSSVLLLLSTGFAADHNSLYTAINNLHCARDQHAAAKQLRSIQQLELFPPGLPAEKNATGKASIRATTLDIILSTFYQSSLEYPNNKDLIQDTVIAWNFCHVIDSGKFYDISFNNNKIEKSETTNPQHHWAGFKAFGLINSDLNSFKFTSPYKSSVMNSLADLRLLKTYLQHCLPHPDDSHLYRDFGRNFISRVVPSSINTNLQANEMWEFTCAVPELEKNPLDDKEIDTEKMEPKISQSIESSEPSIDLPDKLTAIPAFEKPVTSPKKDTPIIRAAKTETIPIKANASIQPLETGSEISESNYPPAVVTTSSPGGNAVHSKNIKTSKGFSGSISLQNRSFISENTSLNFAFAYKPIQDSYWFIRSALNLSQQDEPISYSWGIGYDDWHPGTWGIQLNHWGPLKRGDNLDIKNAVAEINYKVDSDTLKKHRLSSSIALSKPLTGEPSLSWGWSWNPHSNWFIRSTLIKPVIGTLNWSYGFGYTSYAKSSLSLEYNNWGVNRFPKTNFKKNGQLSLTYRWEF